MKYISSHACNKCSGSLPLYNVVVDSYILITHLYCVETFDRSSNARLWRSSVHQTKLVPQSFCGHIDNIDESFKSKSVNDSTMGILYFQYFLTYANWPWPMTKHRAKWKHSTNVQCIALPDPCFRPSLCYMKNMSTYTRQKGRVRDRKRSNKNKWKWPMGEREVTANIDINSTTIWYYHFQITFLAFAVNLQNSWKLRIVSCHRTLKHLSSISWCSSHVTYLILIRFSRYGEILRHSILDQRPSREKLFGCGKMVSLGHRH